MGSATEQVSVFIKWMIIAAALTGLLQTEGDSIGADGWRPLITIARPIPLLVPAVLPPETGAAGAIGATAAPFVLCVDQVVLAAGALCFYICADIATLPIESHPVISEPLASIHPLTVLREEKEEKEQQHCLQSKAFIQKHKKTKFISILFNNFNL